MAARSSRRRDHASTWKPATLTLPTDAASKFPIEAFARHCLLNGVDELGFLLSQAAEIDAYEQRSARMKARIAVIAGDGIGPEVTAEAVRVLQAVAQRFGHRVRAARKLLSAASRSIARRSAARTRRSRPACSRRGTARRDRRAEVVLAERQAAARGGTAAAAQGDGRVREPASGARAPGRCAAPRRSSPRSSRAWI